MCRSLVRSAIAAVLSIGILSLGVTMVLSNWSPARSACANLKAVEGAWGQWGSCEGILTKSCSRIKYPDTLYNHILPLLSRTVELFCSFGSSMVASTFWCIVCFGAWRKQYG